MKEMDMIKLRRWKQKSNSFYSDQEKSQKSQKCSSLNKDLFQWLLNRKYTKTDLPYIVTSHSNLIFIYRF